MTRLVHPRLDLDREHRWLVVQTKPRVERIVCAHLAQRGLEPYCPLFLEPPWHRRAPRGPVPLFTGYVFVRCDPREDINAVRYCPGVMRPLSFAGVLATVDDALVSRLRDCEGEAGVIVSDRVKESLQRGRRVRIMGGPLRGLEGVFDGYIRGGMRARILIEFLRSRRSVEADAEAILAV